MEEQVKYTLDELKQKLTEKEKNFCHEYVRDWNGARAAREAGYSEKSCYDIGSENPRKPHIEQYCNFIKNDYEKECNITKISQLKIFLDIINDKESSNRDKISALTEINKMMGYNEPDKINIANPDGSMQPKTINLTINDKNISLSE